MGSVGPLGGGSAHIVRVIHPNSWMDDQACLELHLLCVYNVFVGNVGNSAYCASRFARVQQHGRESATTCFSIRGPTLWSKSFLNVWLRVGSLLRWLRAREI